MDTLADIRSWCILALYGRFPGGIGYQAEMPYQRS